jgi:thiol-disulfide isomerase/thioredoxin
MTPALPACFALDAQRKLIGGFWFDLRQKDGGAVTAHEGIANLLLKAGVQLSEADRPKEVAAPDAWLKPKPKAAEAAVTALETGKTAPDFSLQTLDGKTVKLSDYKGKVVVLDFWATWCVWCLKGMPAVEEVRKKYAGNDKVQFLALSQDEADVTDEQIAQAEGAYILGSTNWMGRTVPYHASAVGKAMLAHGAMSLPSGQLEQLTPKTLTIRADLVRDLEATRQRGYGISIEEIEPGLIAIGAPIRGADRRVIAGIAIAGPSMRITPDRYSQIGELLVRSAAELEARLSHQHLEEGAA